MAEMEAELRELLHRKAAEVPPHGEIPGGVLKRARRRAVTTVAGGLLTLALVAFGGYQGVQAIASGPSRQTPIHPPTPTRSPAGPGPCAATALTPTLAFDHGAGHAFGAIRLTNHSTGACTLQGQPVLIVTDAGGNPIPVNLFVSDPMWRKNAQQQPAGWPVVTLQPGRSAQISADWSNACGGAQGQPTVSWEIEVPGGGAISVTLRSDTADIPSCNGKPTDRPDVQLGPFEPA
jgi:hypothetical protein